MVQKGGNSGIHQGQLKLGNAFETGSGCAYNLDKAHAWYQKAEDQGYPPGRRALKKLEEKIDILHKEPPKTEVARDISLARHSGKPPILIPKEEVNAVNTLADQEIRHLDNDKGTQSDGAAFLAAVMQTECSDFTPDYLERQSLTTEAELTEDDPDLNFESGYRFKGGDTTDERQAAYTGLSWDMLNNGLFGNKSQARRLEMQKKISEIRGKQQRHKDLFSCRDTFLTQ